MKFLVKISVLFCLLFIISSCNKTDYKPLKNVDSGNLVGTWESISSVEETFQGTQSMGKESFVHDTDLKKRTLIYRADKTGYEKSFDEDTQEWEEGNFLYSVKGNKISVNYSDEIVNGIINGLGIQMVLTYSISGDKLTTITEVEIFGLKSKETVVYVRK